ncbi:MAG: FAD binding domain-containing protein [Williamsia sp.]|nr:FAD binding domain-containing protein [Williamsia sp.]
MIRFILNDTELSTDLPAGTTLLDFVRYNRRLTGTKIGCREGDCGACSVLIGELIEEQLRYRSYTSCLTPLGNVQGKHVVTIEGLNPATGLNPVQQAMSSCSATQCGFCTPGFVVSLAQFCVSGKEATVQNAIAAMDGNICRCTGYKSIERAAEEITGLLSAREEQDPLQFAVGNNILPAYFSLMKARLMALRERSKELRKPRSTQAFRVAGGTDLYVQRHDELDHDDIHFMFDDPALRIIRRQGNQCIMGPAVTATDLQESAVIREAFPHFSKQVKAISSTPIRNGATIAGNFVNASPIGDFSIFFLAADAQLLLSDGNHTRRLPLRKLYKGYKQLDLKAHEHIREISFTLPGKETCVNFEKVSKRTHLDIASVNSALFITMNGDLIAEAGLAAGGVAPVPLCLQQTADFLVGKHLEETLIGEAIAIAKEEISPVSDARGTAAYKTLLLGQLIKAHFISLFPRLDASRLLHLV